MARVHVQRAVSAGPVATRHKTLTDRKKPSYKVVLEQVTQERRKLDEVVSFRAKPPPGYTFIPAGDPQITNRCKQLARADGAKVFVVSTTKHQHTDTLSHQVHRIGYHFPSSIVDRACISLGVTLNRAGHVLHQQQDWTPGDNQHERHSKRRKFNVASISTQPELSQATIDTQAREAIKDLFPKIPQKDLHDIVTRAFEKGKNKVGTADNLTLPRRVQLAVVAHIRHNYTDYDKLLRTQEWLAARALVEQACLDLLVQWRGDTDDDNPNSMEEILREVIVIPDDDDDDDNIISTSARQRYMRRENSVEIVSSRAFPDDMVTRPIDYGSRDLSIDRLDTPQSDIADGTRFLGHGQYAFSAQPPRDPNKAHRLEIHRQRAWEQALDRGRKNPHTTNADTNASFHSSTVEDKQGISQIHNPGRIVRVDSSSNDPQSTAKTSSRVRQMEPALLRESSRNALSGKMPFVEQILLPTPEQSSYLVRQQGDIPRNGHNSLVGLHSSNHGSNLVQVLNFSPFTSKRIPGTKGDSVLKDIDESAMYNLPTTLLNRGARPEPVYPSIEGSPRAEGHQVIVDSIDRPSVKLRPFYMASSPTQGDNLNSDKHTQLSKRRKVSSIIPLIRDQHVSSTRVNNTRSVFIPIEHYHDSHSAEPVGNRFQKQMMVKEPSVHVSATQPVPQQDQKEFTPLYTRRQAQARQDDLLHIHSAQRSAHGYHDQSPISSRQLRIPDISEHCLRQSSNLLPAFDGDRGQDSLHYEVPDSYAPLRHDIVPLRIINSEQYEKASDMDSLTRRRQAPRLVLGRPSEELRYSRPLTIERPVRLAREAEAVRNPLHAEDSHHPELARTRTYLPLERSFERLAPLSESTWLEYREAPLSPSGESEPRHSRSSRLRSPPRPQQVTLLRRNPKDDGFQPIGPVRYYPVTNTQKHDSMFLRDDNRDSSNLPSTEPYHEQVLLSNVENPEGMIYRQPLPGDERPHRRLWDAHSGRELIVLD